MQEIILKFTLDEINAIVQTLGKLPTSADVWPLLHSIVDQTNSQLTKETEVTE